MTDKARTGRQNSSLHGTLDEYAGKLNDAGFDYTKFLEKAVKKGFTVPWTKTNLKEFYNALAVAMYGKTSSDLTTSEIQDVYRVFEQKIADESGVTCPWFSQDSLRDKSGWWT